MLRQLKTSAAALLFTLGCAWHAPEAEAAAFIFNGSFSQPNDVQLFSFTVGAAGSNVVIETFNFHSSGGAPFGTVVETGGFDPLLSLFDPSGNFITAVVGDIDAGGPNFDSRINTGSNPGSPLAQGVYYVALTQYDNFFASVPGANLFTNPSFVRAGQTNYTTDDFQDDGLGCDFAFIDQECNERLSDWALGIAGEGVTAASIVPLPAALPLLATALAGMGFLGWRRGAARA